MVGPAHHIVHTFADYIQIESEGTIKHEFLAGQVFAMSGGSLEHAALAGRMIQLLGRLLGARPCLVFTSDLRVRIKATGLTTYPDVSVVCGPVQRDPEDANTVLNPIVLVEVLSPSTAAYDRGGKFEHYRQIEALQAYLLVSQDQRQIELRQRSAGGGWTTAVVVSGGSLHIDALGGNLAVDEVYAGLVG